MRCILFFLLVVLLVGCKKNRLDIDVSHINVDLEINQLEKVLFHSSDEMDFQTSFQNIYEQNSQFIDLYTEDIIRVGKIEQENFYQNFSLFLSDTVTREVADTVLRVFNDFSVLEKELTKGFKHLKFYFPHKKIPIIYTYVSVFNQSLVVGDGFIGVSLDNYLGADCPFYGYLGIPKYKSAKMYPQKIIPDVFYAYALTEFPSVDETDNLLDNMIYEGKMVYFCEAMTPDLPDSVLMGYSAKQLDWCEQNEGRMWTYLAEKKLLYDQERLTLQKFIGDSPYTGAFSNDSPGRTGIWLGWQIVRSFMNNNPEITLTELIGMEDSQDILVRAAYYPQ